MTKIGYTALFSQKDFSENFVYSHPPPPHNAKILTSSVRAFKKIFFCLMTRPRDPHVVDTIWNASKEILESMSKLKKQISLFERGWNTDLRSHKELSDQQTSIAQCCCVYFIYIMYMSKLHEARYCK